MQYQITIRSYHNDNLGESTGHTDWEATLLRLAARLRLCGRNDTISDTYFPTDLGRPWGTHHVQFGRSVKGDTGRSMSPTYIVGIQPL